ncbi:MAG: amidohydrolase [Acidimicrobiia bacterium]|nr:amidohydrolase [Acidimicrobiia bacterium]
MALTEIECPGWSMARKDGATGSSTATSRSPPALRPASYDPAARVEMMDQLGVYAQILYPNVAGFGNQNFLKVSDEDLRILSVQLYNDHIAEMQEASGQRIFGMALMPWWDIAASVAEARRCHDPGLRGVVTCSNPEEAGLPDLGTDTWNPFWEVCTELSLPVNFHIGSSKGNMDFYGKAQWPSFGEPVHGELPGRRQPDLLRSAGAVPRREVRLGRERDRLDTVLPRSARSPDRRDHAKRAAAPIVAAVGVLPPPVLWMLLVRDRRYQALARRHRRRQRAVRDRLPHPTCLYPRTDGRVREALEGLVFATRKRILQDNAQDLYGIPVPR